jgi:hypothetical protein
MDTTAHEWRLEPGAFTLRVGHHVEDLPLAVTVTV